MNLIQETKFIMNKYNISANKSLGQNFLINENIVDNIIKSSNISKNDLIIEIGPGLGTLTSQLLENAGKVIAIEFDNKMLTILNERFKLYNNLTLINNDVLKVDLNKLINENLNENITNCKVVANLPYYITTPIITKLLGDKLPLKSITVMVQKEVAERLTAIPGQKNTGSITYIIYYFSNAKIILDVPKNCFIPAPDVNSSVINLEILDTPRVKIDNEKLFFDIIKSGFSQKRKTILNNLVNSKIISSKEKAEQLLSNIGIDSNIRAEKLSLENFAKIYEEIQK